LFLLLLNIALLVVGALMDIFAAILVVVPLLKPLAAAYHIDPVQMGVIFIANLELGYLHPPVGINLFLSAYRFKKPMGTIIWATLPFLLILAASVLLITYVPWLHGPPRRCTGSAPQTPFGNYLPRASRMHGKRRRIRRGAFRRG
jgi:C4-dicarboxylate transporter DctM subunit